MSQQGPLTGGGNVSGNVVQIAYTQSQAPLTINTIIPADNTIPQQTEGTEIFTVSITPTKATNILFIKAIINVSANNPVSAVFAHGAIFQDATANAISTFFMELSPTGTLDYNGCAASYIMPAGTTSSTTFKIRGGVSAGGDNLYINTSFVPLFGGTLTSTFTVTELEV